MIYKKCYRYSTYFIIKAYKFNILLNIVFKKGQKLGLKLIVFFGLNIFTI